MVFQLLEWIVIYEQIWSIKFVEKLQYTEYIALNLRWDSVNSQQFNPASVIIEIEFENFWCCQRYLWVYVYSMMIKQYQNWMLILTAHHYNQLSTSIVSGQMKKRKGCNHFKSRLVLALRKESLSLGRPFQCSLSSFTCVKAWPFIWWTFRAPMKSARRS